MAKTEPRTSPPAFEIEITSGGRAADSSDVAPKEALTLSPARAAAKARARRRTTLIVLGAGALLAGFALWMWLSNPLALVPGDAVARVNGEFVYERDVSREADMRRALGPPDGNPDATVPSPASLLEEIIYRKLQVQDARKAGVAATPDEVDRGLANLVSAQKTTEAGFADSLSRYNLTLDDVRAYITGILLAGKREGQVMERGASEQERQTLRNEWQTRLAQEARIERLKPAGSGPAPRVGSEAPDFSLKALDGAEIKLSSLRGRPVMLNFWATWCPPCRAEIPTIVDVYRNAQSGTQFEILGIATQSNRETIQAFADEFAMTFPLLPDVESRLTSLYHVLPIPTSFFIDRDGIIRDVRVGVVDKETMERWLLEK